MSIRRATTLAGASEVPRGLGEFPSRAWGRSGASRAPLRGRTRFPSRGNEREHRRAARELREPVAPAVVRRHLVAQRYAHDPRVPDVRGKPGDDPAGRSHDAGDAGVHGKLSRQHAYSLSSRHENLILTQQGFKLIHPARTEPWGQSVARLLSDDGAIIVFTTSTAS